VKWISQKFNFDPSAWRKGFEIAGKLWCLERSTIFIDGQKYMTRYIVYAFGGTLRLHKFFRGDDDRAPHTHPWNFWTFPLSRYDEQRYNHGNYVGTFTVKAWRWHRRSCLHEHIVTSRSDCDGSCEGSNCSNMRPFWTIVVTGPRINEWGFYDTAGKFTHWRDRK
jgi:hypothetical protein